MAQAVMNPTSIHENTDSIPGGGWGVGVWDGNAVKLGCDDHCTTINVIKFF